MYISRKPVFEEMFIHVCHRVKEILYIILVYGLKGVWREKFKKSVKNIKYYINVMVKVKKRISVDKQFY